MCLYYTLYVRLTIIILLIINAIEYILCFEDLELRIDLLD